jgi:hypothetical protein
MVLGIKPKVLCLLGSMLPLRYIANPKRLISRRGQTSLIVYSPNDRASHYMKQNQIKVKEEIDSQLQLEAGTL